ERISAQGIGEREVVHRAATGYEATAAIPAKGEIEGAAHRPGVEAAGIESTIAVPAGPRRTGQSGNRLVHIERPAYYGVGTLESLEEIRTAEMGRQGQR